MMRTSAPNTDEFRSRLSTELANAAELGKTDLVVTARCLHNLVGGYAGTTNHRMPVCCDVMWAEKRDGDEVLKTPPSRTGATLKIRYKLPR